MNASQNQEGFAIFCEKVTQRALSVGGVPYEPGIWAVALSCKTMATALIGVPLVLSLLPLKTQEETFSSSRGAGAFEGFARFVTGRSGSAAVLATALAVYIGGGMLSSNVQIGESEPGSPILYHDHDYNISSAKINANFPGSEEMYVVATTSEPGGIKRPEVLRALQDFQIHMLSDTTKRNILFLFIIYILEL